MNRIRVNKARSYAEANRFDLEYYLTLRPEERLDEMQRLRDDHWKLGSERENASRKRLRRSVRIVQQA
jgi:hypothetical protein